MKLAKLIEEPDVFLMYLNLYGVIVNQIDNNNF